MGTEMGVGLEMNGNVSSGTSEGLRVEDVISAEACWCDRQGMRE